MAKIEFLSFDQCRDLDCGYLVTVNLQHLFESRSRPLLRSAIFDNPKARLCIDGRGALLLLERMAGHALPLVVGNEVLRARLDRASSQGEKILVIGSTPDVISAVEQRWPGLRITHDASRVMISDDAEAKNSAKRVLSSYGDRFDYIAIALGVPKQELLAAALSENRPNMPIYCIGGSFEMLTGKLRRAPSFVQRIGLEGLWRLMLQPRRDRLDRLVRSYWSFAVFLLHPNGLRKLFGARFK